MNWRDCPWFTVIQAFCFVEDTIFPYKYFTTNYVIIIYSWIVFTLSIKISLALPVVSNFVPVSYVGDVEQHIPSKYCRAWGGFKYCMVGRANGPSRIGLECGNVTGCYWVGHIYFSSVEHRHNDMMHLLIAFTWGFLTLFGLRLMPYESHRASKWSSNSLLLS